MLLTPDLNHPSIVQLSPEYCSSIECLYHKYLQRSKLIVTASLEYVDTASFSFGGSELVRGASSSHGCSISLEILPYQRLFHHPLVEIISLSFPVFCFDVVEDALAQGADGLGLMKNEDHQVLGNEQKLEEDASDCTRVDDDGVEFSPEDDVLDRSLYLAELLKMALQLMNLLTALLFSHDSEMNIRCSSLAHSYERLLLKAKHSTQSIGELTEFKSRLMQHRTGLDELKHDLSTEESVAQKCKIAIVKNKREIIRENIEPNKVGSEEVANLDPDQLPTLAFVGSFGPEGCLLILLRQDGADDSGPVSLRHTTIFWSTSQRPYLTTCTPIFLNGELYQLLRSSSGDSGPDVSFDMSASPEHLYGSARARLATSTLSGQLRLSHLDCLKETIPYHMHTNTLQAELVYLDLRNYREFYKFSSMPMHGLVICIGIMYRSSILILHYHGYAGGSFPNSFQWHAPIGGSEFSFWNLHVKVSKEFLFPYPADQALFTRFDKYLFRQMERVWWVLLIGTSGPTDGANVEAYLRGPLGLGKRALNLSPEYRSDIGSAPEVCYGGLLKSSAPERNLDSRVIDESPTEGFTLDNLSKLCCRCAKFCNIAVVVFVHSGLNASCYNLLANHTAILVAEDTCLPDLTTNERIDLVRSFNLVRSFDRRTRKKVDPSVILLPHVLPTNPDRIGSSVVHKTLIFLGMLVLLKKLEEDAPDCTRVDDDGVEFSHVPYYMPRPYADGESVIPPNFCCSGVFIVYDNMSPQILPSIRFKCLEVKEVKRPNCFLRRAPLLPYPEECAGRRDGGLIFSRMMSDLDVLLWWTTSPTYMDLSSSEALLIGYLCCMPGGAIVSSDVAMHRRVIKK
ncbi:hypothetical protein Tco_1067941 [Tanacetum coccineum]|uniref:Uncharacterized protein n=1 Tax=Tanacetum coccineum TaxID=301880 RepID=A0ABQ5HF74_9ASTR